MIECLAIPGWRTPPVELKAWVERLGQGVGGPIRVVRDDPSGSWLEVGVIRLRGFAVLAGQFVEAIHFEVTERDPEPALAILRGVSDGLGWEIHLDDEEDEGDDD